jgi:hypothetical protein
VISNVLSCVAINTLNALTSSVSTRHYQHFQRVTIKQFFFQSNIDSLPSTVQRNLHLVLYA